MSDSLHRNVPKAETDDTLLDDWRDASLADVADIRVSNVDKKSAFGEVPVRLCNYINVYNNEYITAALDFMEATATPSELARFSVEIGDVIITKDSETPDDIGVPAVAVWSDPRLVCGYHLALFKLDKYQVDPVFLAKQIGLPRIAAYYGRLACGSTRYGLSNSGIARSPLRLPPVNQQRKIARILTTLDNVIEKTVCLIAKYQAMKQGMMHDLFARGVDAHGHLRPPQAEAPDLYKQSELGWIPRAWSVASAKELCHEITKGATPAQMYDEPGLANVPFIRVQNLSFDGTLSFEDEQWFIPWSVHRTSLIRSIVFPGDVLMNLVGPPMGKVSLIPSTYSEWNINQAIAIFRPLDTNANVFLSHFLLSQIAFKWFISRAKRTSGQTNLTLEMCRQLPVPIPHERHEQDRITDLLNTADTRLVSENAVLKKLIQIKTGLMEDLLTGKVRVKVDKAGEVAAND